jgi:hypothetical protein
MAFKAVRLNNFDRGASFFLFHPNLESRLSEEIAAKKIDDTSRPAQETN